MNKTNTRQKGWQTYSLIEVIDVIGGGTPKTAVAEYWDGDIPWLSVTDFNTDRKFVFDSEKRITEEGLQNSNAKILNKEDIIISARGTVGVVATIGRSMAFNQSCYGVRAKNNLAINNYIYYLFKNMTANLLQRSHGGVFDTITRNTFREIQVSLPPLTEQKAIAEVLSSLDDKIDLLHRQNKTLEDMAQTLFRKQFVEDADETWEKGVLPNEFDFLMGQSPKGHSFNEEKVGLPMYQGNADFDFRFPNRRVYTTEAKRLAKKYDTLISVRAPVGEQNMALEKCCIGRGLAAFRYKLNSEYYTYTYFKMRSLMKYIKRFDNEGTIFGSVSKTDFQALPITIPPKNLIDKYQNEAKPIDAKVIQNSIQIHTLEKLRDTLLPKLMSGAVWVNFT